MKPKVFVYDYLLFNEIWIMIAKDRDLDSYLLLTWRMIFGSHNINHAFLVNFLQRRL